MIMHKRIKWTIYLNLSDFSDIDSFQRESLSWTGQKCFLLHQFEKLFTGMSFPRPNDLDVYIAVRSHGFLRTSRDSHRIWNGCQV